MKLLVSHPTGNRNVRAVIASAFQLDMLAEFDTTVAMNQQSAFIKTLPKGLLRELQRRSYDVPGHLIRSYPWRELARMLLPKLGLKSITRHETGLASVDKVYQHFDKAVANRLVYLQNNKDLTAVYAYEDGALATFTKAKALGLRRVYDLPIAYWETSRRLLLEEAERMPHWKKTLGGGILNSQQKLERKTKELELAEVVVTPGSFVAESLPQWANSKQVIVSPFGSPELSATSIKNERRKEKNQPLRVLFAGSMGQRKGLGDIFSAIKLLNRSDVEMVVMGSLLESIDFYKQQLLCFTYEPGRAHHEVLALMHSCDVFCLPSIVEGRALVMQEAMSQGLPLIITPNTGGADLVMEGKTGFLVPIRSPEQIAEKIDWYASHRAETEEMGEWAKEHAARYTWEQYGQTIIDRLQRN